MGYRNWLARNMARNTIWKGVAATAMAVGLSGCSAMYGGGIYSGGGYYGDDYYGDGYYDDGYGYGYDDYGYDPYYDDYRAGYPNIGYGGGWYNNYYYPGYGTYIYDRWGQYWLMNQYYRNYWGSWRDDWGRRHHRDWGRDHDRDGRRGEGFNPGRIAREALEAPRQGDAPRLRARPENINRSSAQVVRDGRTDNARQGRGGGFGDRAYQRTNPQDGNRMSQPRVVPQRQLEQRQIEERQIQQRQIEQRGDQGGFGRRIIERARPQAERQQPSQQRPRAVAPAPQQRQQVAPAPRNFERPAPTRPAPRGGQRSEGGQVRDQ